MIVPVSRHDGRSWNKVRRYLRAGKGAGTGKAGGTRGFMGRGVLPRSTRRRAGASWGVTHQGGILPQQKRTWLKCYEAHLLRKYIEGVSQRKRRRAAREARVADHAQDRARQREDRSAPCGAKTRAGHSCKRKGHGRGGRCPNHGGLSTGPKTPEGHQRIAEAQRRRWATQRPIDDEHPPEAK